MLKPFSLHELRARCRALLRRKREARLQLRAGDLELDRLDHSARRGGQTVMLTNKEFALLEHLMLNRGNAFRGWNCWIPCGTWSPRRPPISWTFM